MSSHRLISNTPICAFFVYGTLKRGCLREGTWPRQPQNIVPGRIQGALWDAGPYPVLTTGMDWVLGELWSFDPDHMPITIEALDETEGCSPLSPLKLYRREIITVVVGIPDTTQDIRAYAYVMRAEIATQSMRRMHPHVHALGTYCVRWPDSESNPPQNFEEEARWEHSVAKPFQSR